MATLKFKGPFHFDHIYDPKKKSTQGKCGKINSLLKPNKPGIYIWGFMFDKKIENKIDFRFEKINDYLCESELPIGVNINDNGWKFIPYYVGLDDKLFTRIISHHAVTSGNAAKYARMSQNGYKFFFKIIPLNTGNNFVNSVKSFVKSNMIINPYSYFNNMDVLIDLYGNDCVRKVIESDKNNNPIGSVEVKISGNWVKIFDTLEDIVINNNNFWFCYAELDDTNKANYAFNNLTDLEFYKLVNNNFLEYPEAQTFYSLKGITISKTLKHGTPNPFGVNFKIDAVPTCMDIFKQDPIGNIIDYPTYFPGY